MDIVSTMADGAVQMGARRRVGAVVVVHGMNDDLATCLSTLARQCDEVVAIDNLPQPETRALLAEAGVRVIANPHVASFAHNVNTGVESLDTDYVAVVNPDAVADAECIETLVDFLESRRTAGVVAPQLRWPDGRLQPTGRSFPTVGATVLRRSPLRRLWPPADRQTHHYRLDRTGTDEPWRADWLLGAFWVVRRSAFDRVGGMDGGYRMYVEDMDFCARLAEQGLERWVVPAATAVHEYQAVIDRRFVSMRNWWHARGMARFARRHPTLLARRRTT